MSLLLVDSCDYPIYDYPGLWDSEAVASQTTVDGVDCYHLNGDRTNALVRLLDSAEEDDTVILHFRIRFTSWSSNADDGILFLYGDSGTTLHIEMEQGGNGIIWFKRGGSTIVGQTDMGAIAANTWHEFTVKVVLSDTVGSVELWIDSVKVVNETNIDTKNGGTGTNFDAIQFGNQRNTQSYVSDIILMNSKGTTNNDRIGNGVRVTPLKPDGDGNYSAWTAAGAGSHYVEVDEENPDEDTSYVETSTAGNRDSFTFEDLAGTPTIYGVVALVLGKTTGTALQVAPFVRRSTTDSDGDSAYVGVDYQYIPPTIWNEDPIAAAAWTAANLNASEFGVVSSA